MNFKVEVVDGYRCTPLACLERFVNETVIAQFLPPVTSESLTGFRDLQMRISTTATSQHDKKFFFRVKIGNKLAVVRWEKVFVCSRALDLCHNSVFIPCCLSAARCEVSRRWRTATNNDMERVILITEGRASLLR